MKRPGEMKSIPSPGQLRRATVLHVIEAKTTMTQSTKIRAEAAIANLGERATEARRRTLEVLLKAERPLSHAEIETELATRGTLDRVTLYRVLDWLVAKGLAHKIEGHDRAWRFNATVDDARGHAHFCCTDCSKVYCLTGVKPAFVLSLPPGFRLGEADLSLRGTCPDCQPH